MALQGRDAAQVERLSKTPKVLNATFKYHDQHSGRTFSMTALHTCVQNNDQDLLEILLQPEKKADTNIVNETQSTPKFFAVGRARLMEMLLQAGANPNHQDFDGRTPLMLCALRGYFDTTKLLLDAGADIYLGSDVIGMTALDNAQELASGRFNHRILVPENQTLEERLDEAKKSRSPPDTLLCGNRVAVPSSSPAQAESAPSRISGLVVSIRHDEYNCGNK